MAGAKRVLVPTAIVALGENTQQGLQFVKKSLLKDSPNLHDLSVFAQLDAQGAMRFSPMLDSGRIEKPSTTTPRVILSDVQTFAIDLVGGVSATAQSLTEAFRNIELSSTRNDLRESLRFNEQLEIQPRRDLWILATSFDETSCAAIIPMLVAYVGCQCRGLERRTTCNIVLLTPDALKSRDASTGYEQTKKVFESLDVCEDHLNGSSGLNLDEGRAEVYVWLISGRDERGEIIESDEQIFRDLTQFIIQCQGEDPDVSAVQGKRSEARRKGVHRIYNTFGIRRIFIPAREAAEAGTLKATQWATEKTWLNKARDVDAREIAMAVSKFLRENHFFELEEGIRNGNPPDKLTIKFREEFKPFNLQLNSESLLARVDDEFAKYEKQLYPTLELRVSDRARTLLARHLDAIVTRVEADYCDQKTRGPVVALSFVNSLLGHSREKVGTGALDAPDDLLRIQELARSRGLAFFDQLSDYTEQIAELTRDLQELEEHRQRLIAEPAQFVQNLVPRLDEDSSLREELREERLEELTLEIRDISSRRSNFIRQQEQSLSWFENPLRRRDYLRERREQNRVEVIEPARQRVLATEPKRSQLLTEIGSYEKATGRERLWSMVLLPFLLIISLVPPMYFELPWDITWWILGTGSAAWIAWRVYREALVIHPKLRRLREQLASCNEERLANLSSMINGLQRGLEDRLEEYLISQVSELASRIRSGAEALASRYAAFCDQLRDESQLLGSSWTQLLDSIRPFDGNLASKELLERSYDRLRADLNQCQREIEDPPQGTDAHYVSRCIRAGDSPVEMTDASVPVERNKERGAKAASDLIRSVKAQLAPLFKRWSDAAIEQWVEDPDVEDDCKPRMKQEMMARLNHVVGIGVPALAQVVERAAGIREMSIRLRNEHWSGAAEIKRRIGETCPVSVDALNDPHQILLTQRIRGLKADETMEYSTAKYLSAGIRLSEN